MFDAPVDALYVWVGLTVVAGLTLGAAVELPTTAEPDAEAAAASVDRVAAADHDATGRHPVAADAVAVDPHGLSLRDGGRTADATFAYGPVVPVDRGSALWDVLKGVPPDERFDDPNEFRAATDEASQATDAERTDWQTADQLLVRTTTWEGNDVTLVGA